jgi:hypothetical protein
VPIIITPSEIFMSKKWTLYPALVIYGFVITRREYRVYRKPETVVLYVAFQHSNVPTIPTSASLLYEHFILIGIYSVFGNHPKPYQEKKSSSNMSATQRILSTLLLLSAIMIYLTYTPSDPTYFWIYWVLASIMNVTF